MARCLIGIDNGSQSTKVTVFDERGTAVSSGRRALRPYDEPRPGVAEHPGDDLWDSIGAAAREAMRGFPGDAADIAGVGLCTIRFCRAVLRADGALAQPVMSWMDERLARPYEPESPHARWVTTSSGHIGQRMTGEFRDTAANCAGMWPVDPGTWRWTEDASCGIPREMLFELVLPGEVLGRVTPEAAAHTGIPAGLPVVATANDKAVEALGCGLLSDSGTLLVSLGTYIAGMTAGHRHLPDASACWTNFGSVPHTYLYESAGVRRGMWTVSWLRDLLGTDERVLDAEAAQVPPGSEGLLTALDWLAPAEAPFRKGTVLGFDGRQGRAHLHRSILEGIALTLRATTAAMAAELGTGWQRLLLSGGGARSELMARIFADVFGIPVRRCPGGAGLGAAICAAVGTGVHPSFAAARAAMIRAGEPVHPDPGTHRRYRRIAEVYDRIREHTDPLYRLAGGIADL